MTRTAGPGDVRGLGRGFAFVGRERELRVLFDAVRRPPAVVLVEGEAGIGKSRLLREAAAVLTAEGRPVLTGLCHPLREPFPYGPVVDALRGAGPLLPPVGRIPPTAGALAPLLPDLADRLPPPPQGTPGEARLHRHQIAQAVRSLLTAVGPVVLVVEDLHWADEATRELLLLLARDAPGQLSLVLTYRAEDLPAGATVLGAAYSRPPGVGGTTVRIERLAGRDVLELATAALGRSGAAELGDALYTRSEGLPLVAEEDLITLCDRAGGRERGDLVARLCRAAVPAGLREAVTGRLDALPPAGASIVAAAAVLAVPSTEPVLARVAGVEPSLGAEGLAAAIRAAVLREGEPGRYVFRHVLAQQVAYRHVPAPTRTRLHERAVEELRSWSPPPLVQIAHHTLAAGDLAAWYERAEEAAEEATALGDTGTAATLLRRLLDRPELDGERRERVALALARLAVNGADFTASAGLLRRLLADAHLPVPVRGEIRLALGLLTINQLGDRSGFGELEEAVRELAERPVLAARAMTGLAVNERDGATVRARDWLDRAERTLGGSADEAARAAVLATRLSLLVRDGEPGAWEELDRLPRGAEDGEVLRQTARALYNSARMAIETGHDRRAGRLLAECRSLTEQLGLTSLTCFSRLALLQLEFLAGRWTGIEERLTGLRAEYPDMAPLFDLKEEQILARLAIARGKFRQGAEHLKAASGYAERHAQVSDVLWVAAGLATVRLARQDTEGAFAAVVPAVAALREAGTWARTVGLIRTAVEAALAAGRRDFARRLVEDAEEGLVGRVAPAGRAELALARGLLLRVDAPQDAAAHFEDARRRWQEIGRPYESADAAEQVGRALAPQQPDEASGRLAEALDAFTDLGATEDAARCRRAVRDLGLAGGPEPSGHRGYGDELSPREREVAGLLAGGATNQDIARSLVLSQRTVEKHVAQVLRKLRTTRANVHKALPADR
ncbi:ATP-binding protein [Kitasatospora sp. NPDC089509]|uniref:ATP-binding protein n=1 Tax=Kitasatospora sp. NPDC089509 TaxID=3364079 RepID=UPI00381A6454